MNSFIAAFKHQFTSNKWWQNIAVWLVFFITFCLTAQFDEETYFSEVAIVVFALTIMLSIPIYTTNLVLLPIFRRGRRWQAVSLYLLFLLFFAWISDDIVKMCFRLACNLIDCSEDMQDVNIGSTANLFGTNLLSTAIGLAIRVARDSVIEKSKNQEAELQLLKGQLNPHFLFNTLNNLYGLSVVKSDKLPGLMLKLSDLLRYSLYQTKDHQVPLSKEITYLHNYLDLERLRLNDEVEVDLTIRGDSSTKLIAPMLLIVFLENAFKHFGTSKKQTAYIRIGINIQEDQLQFHCENSKDPQSVISPREQNTSGIGLANVRQRLALLYPGQHQLEVKNDNATFSVRLSISALSTATAGSTTAR